MRTSRFVTRWVKKTPSVLLLPEMQNCHSMFQAIQPHLGHMPAGVRPQCENQSFVRRWVEKTRTLHIVPETQTCNARLPKIQQEAACKRKASTQKASEITTLNGIRMFGTSAGQRSRKMGLRPLACTRRQLQSPSGASQKTTALAAFELHRYLNRFYSQAHGVWVLQRSREGRKEKCFGST